MQKAGFLITRHIFSQTLAQILADSSSFQEGKITGKRNISHADLHFMTNGSTISSLICYDDCSESVSTVTEDFTRLKLHIKTKSVAIPYYSKSTLIE